MESNSTNGPVAESVSPGSSSMQQQQQQEQPTSSAAAGSGGAGVSHQPAGAEKRQIGTCKWFNATKGYGFITSSSQGEQGEQQGGEDLFVHQSNIISEGFRSLREGETVEYDTETSPDGRTKAINVTGPGGAPPQGAPPRNRLPNAGFRGGMGGRRGGRAASMGMMGGMVGAPGRGVAPTAATYANPYGYPAMPAAAAAAAAMQPYYYGYYYPQPADYAVRGGRGARMPGRGMAGAPMMYPSVPAMGMEQPSGLQVVVHNLPWSCTWQQLKDYFRDFKVERADIVEDQWGRSRGFGTVRFSTPEDAQMACDTLSNSQIDGRTISVRIDRFA